VSFIAYLAAGFIRNVYISLLLAVALMVVAIFILKAWQRRKDAKAAV